MRKKYLSALLFGALLVTSAGTFTSCKDYDDEINNLQEQIDVIKTTLSELEKQIGTAGVSSVTFDEATGVLTVVDGNGTKTYKIQTTAEAKVEAVIKDGVLIINDKEIGKVGGDEVVVEDGKLKVNGDVVYEFGPEVVLVKNLDNGTCTLTVGDETVTLPLAVTAVDFKVSINATDYVVFTNYSKGTNTSDLEEGIHWGNSSKDIEWKGPKGNITKDQFLVGQINTASVNVAPATFDLSAIKLELVNTAGEVAPVIVKATPANSEDAETAGNSRTADKKGTWNLSIEMKDEVNENNIATAFATGKGDDDRNYKYALKANGTVVSDYSFVIDTKTAPSQKANNLTVDNFYIDGVKYNSGTNYELGDLKFEYHGDKIYDYYITFVGKDINDAEFKGVTIKDNVITANEKAAGETIEFQVHAIDVLGNELISDAYNNFTIKFEGSTTDPIELTTTNHVASPTFAEDGLVIDLGTTFSGLTAEEATLVNKVKWTTKDSEFIFATNGGLGANKDEIATGVTIEYFKDAECKHPVTGIGADGTWDAQTNIREIKYAKLTGAYNTTAEVGTYNATLTLFKTNNSVDSELKKVTVPVKVTLPAFDELFAKTNDNLWTAEGRTVKLTGTETISLSGIFKSESVTPNKDLKVTSMKFTDADNEVVNLVSASAQLGTAINFTSKGLTEDGKIVDTSLETTVTYTFGSATNLKVESNFTVNLKSQFDGAELAFYPSKDAAAVTEAVLNGNDIIIGGLKGDANGGLSLKFNGDEKAMKAGSDSKGLLGIDQSRELISKLMLTPASYNNVSSTNLLYELSVEDCAATATATVVEDGIQINGLTSEQTGTLVISVRDNDGVEKVLKIPFKK